MSISSVVRLAPRRAVDSRWRKGAPPILGPIEADALLHHGPVAVVALAQTYVLAILDPPVLHSDNALALAGFVAHTARLPVAADDGPRSHQREHAEPGQLAPPLRLSWSRLSARPPCSGGRAVSISRSAGLRCGSLGGLRLLAGIALEIRTMASSAPRTAMPAATRNASANPAVSAGAADQRSVPRERTISRLRSKIARGIGRASGIRCS